ncbi:Glycine oxidase ThiO [Pseudomonas synxantha]|uniref:Glycine oxidase ThiO n=1 Tax=Pseudomonas synxantha TaxID=47883 RepID=A0A3G7U8C4_9PSED|nr:FAD-binding oxidoreductase [Pseudomonas synxantha]AZE55583.1 Glycine oxidase ThiO [Pseudomonas synxantha]
MHQGKRIVVIGAGIVGASLAYHLAGKGANVAVIEAGEVASGVTATSFAWLNTTHDAPDPIAALRSAAIDAYHRLERELPTVKIRWTGALCYGADIQPGADSRITRQRIQALEPRLRNPPEQAQFKAEEGALDAVQTTHALIAGAQAHGATLLTHTRVLGFRMQGSQVTGVETSLGTVDADLVVLAAGTGIPALTKLLGMPLPIEASPAIFIRYNAPPGIVRTLISNPAMEVREGAEGTWLAAEDYLGDAPENQPAAIARRTAQAIADELEGVTFIEPKLACVGLRPVPADGIPIIGQLPGINGVYVCAMHPGVTLAAIVGRLASEEIMEDRVCPALRPCRPERFLRPENG